MAPLTRRLYWQALLVRQLFAYRTRYRRRRDWVRLLLAYGAHTAARFAGSRTRRYRVGVPGDPEPLLVRLGTSDVQALREIFLTRVYDFAVPALRARQPPIRTILDLGANAGYTVRLWLRLFPGCTIVAVEPDEENLRLCMANATTAGAGKVQGVRCFAGAAARVALLDRSLGAWAYRMSESTGEPTPVRTVPEILSTTGLAGADIDLLKCDIEGAEAELFRGGPSWLARVRAVLAEVHPPYTTAALAADVRAAGGAWDATVDGNLVLLVRRDSR